MNVQVINANELAQFLPIWWVYTFGFGVTVLARIATFAPSRATRRAMALPIPRDPPVIKTVFPQSLRLSRDLQNWNSADCFIFKFELDFPSLGLIGLNYDKLYYYVMRVWVSLINHLIILSIY